MDINLAKKPQFLSFAPRSRAAVARRAHNPKVRGSIPLFATKLKARESLFYSQRFKVLMNLITFSSFCYQARLSNSLFFVVKLNA